MINYCNFENFEIQRVRSGRGQNYWQLIIATLTFKGYDQRKDRTIGIAGDLVRCVNSLAKEC